MRLPAAALLAVLSAGTANATAYDCRRPSEPRIPSGQTLETRDLETLHQAVRRYATDMQTYFECLDRETDHALREMEAVGRDYERAIEDFNRR